MKSWYLTLLLVASIMYPQVQAHRPESEYESMLRAIQRESKKLGLRSLSEAAASSAPEVRIWVGFGLAYPRCLVLKLDKGQEAAMFYTARRGKQTTITGSSLNPPKSGWAALKTLLKERGITSPLTFALDDKQIPDADEELLAIEIASRGSYSMVFFPTVTQTSDGKRALEVCKTLEREFSIEMGCHYQA